MSIFEIKICATIIDYQELSLDTSGYVFTNELVKLRNFDGNELNSPLSPEYYSIFYTPEIYVLTYHFATPQKAGFRDQNVHLSVAIKRGFKLCNTLDVLKQLKQQFKQLTTKEKTDIVRTIHTHTDDLNHLVESNLQPDPDQLFINWSSPSTDCKAIIAFDQEEDLSKLLDSPMRNEFKLSNGSGIVYIVYREVAAKAWPKIKNNFTVIQMEGYDFKRTFEVVFPDGGICTVASMGEELDYVCTKPFYKSHHFKGTLLQHITDWKVTQNVDKTQFTIGVSLEPEVKEWKLKLINSIDNSVVDKSILLETSFGVIEGNILILTGDEIGKINDLLFTSLDAQWVVVERPCFSAEEVEVKIKQMIPYNLTQAFQYVEKKYSFSPVFTLYSKYSDKPVAKFGKSTLQQYVDLPYANAFILIAESEKFAACKLFFNSDGSFSQFSLEQKALFTLNFNIANKKVKQRMCEGKELICRYSVENKYYEKALTLADCKISELPGAAVVEFRLEFPGYKVYKDNVEILNKSKIIDVCFRLTTPAIAWKIFKAVWLYILVFCCGIGVGLTINRINRTASLTNQPYVVDSLVEEKRRLMEKDSVAVVEEVIRDSVMDEVMEDSKLPSSEIDYLVKKLEGYNYTWSDIKELKALAPNRERYAQLIRDAELCLKFVQDRHGEMRDMELMENAKYHWEFKRMIRKNRKFFQVMRKHHCHTLREMMILIEKYER